MLNQFRKLAPQVGNHLLCFSPGIFAVIYVPAIQDDGRSSKETSTLNGKIQQTFIENVIQCQETDLQAAATVTASASGR